MAGWGIMFFCLLTNAYRDLNIWSWNCIFVSVLLWYIVDTLISVFYKVNFNVLINTALLIIILFPLLTTRKYFLNKLKL